MEKILNFVREKAFVLILLGSIIAATATGIWAVETVRQNLNKALVEEETQLEQQRGAGLSGSEKGDNTWDQQAGLVAGDMNGKVKQDGQNVQSAPSKSSTPSSGPSSSPEPSATPEPSAAQAQPAAPSFVQPVSGLVVKPFSGDELVLSETLGDWRTHNGVDYAAKLGEEVFACVAGSVSKITTDGNWGGVVEVTDTKGFVWRFCGTVKSGLKEGETVVVGQKLGEIAEISAEMAMEPHLHLEVLKDGKYQNPADHVK